MNCGTSRQPHVVVARLLGRRRRARSAASSAPWRRSAPGCRPGGPARRRRSAAPKLEILNELYWLERTVTTSAVAIGTRTGPRPRKGWPKASTLVAVAVGHRAGGGEPEVAVDQHRGHRARRARGRRGAAAPGGLAGRRDAAERLPQQPLGQLAEAGGRTTGRRHAARRRPAAAAARARARGGPAGHAAGDAGRRAARAAAARRGRRAAAPGRRAGASPRSA